MSYVAFGLTQGCPEGFVLNSTGNCVSSTADICPPGFMQKVPGECWPTTDTSCKDTFGTFFNPAEPDRCKKACPEGTKADSRNVCQQVSPLMHLATPVNIGIGIFGLVALAIVLRR